MPANRRANATTAIFFPRRAAIPRAHSRSAAVWRSGTLSIETAAWTSRRRTRDGPALVMRPRRWCSPELSSRGDQAQIRFDLMSAAEAGHVVQRRHKCRRGHWAHTRDRAQAPHPLIGLGHRLDSLIGVRELLVHLPHYGEERGDLRQQAPGQGQVADAPDEGVGPAAADAPAVLPEPRPDQRDVARPGADQRLADRQPPAHMPLLIGQAMGPTIGAQHTRLSQGPGVSSVRLHFAATVRVHRREVGIGDDHLVPQRLQAPRVGEAISAIRGEVGIFGYGVHWRHLVCGWINTTRQHAT